MNVLFSHGLRACGKGEIDGPYSRKGTGNYMGLLCPFRQRLAYFTPKHGADRSASPPAMMANHRGTPRDHMLPTANIVDQGSGGSDERNILTAGELQTLEILSRT